MEWDSDDLVDTIAQQIRVNSLPPGSPVSTTGDLAEDLDVTAQTVRNHVDEVLAYPSIKTRKIRGASVYWYEQDDPIEGDTPQFGGMGSDEFSPAGWERRGHWQGLRQHLRADAAEGASPARRVEYLWEVFRNFDVLGGPLNVRLNLLREDAGDGETRDYSTVPSEFYEIAEPHVSSEEMEYYFDERRFFETEAYGEVVGVFGFREYEQAVRTEFENEVGTVVLEEIDDEKIDAWVPECEEILDVGDAWMDLISDITGKRW